MADPAPVSSIGDPDERAAEGGDEGGARDRPEDDDSHFAYPTPAATAHTYCLLAVTSLPASQELVFGVELSTSVKDKDWDGRRSPDTTNSVERIRALLEIDKSEQEMTIFVNTSRSTGRSTRS